MCTAIIQKPRDNRLHCSASRICLVRARQICNCPRGALICLGSFAQVHQLRCLTSRVSHTGLIRHQPSPWLQSVLRYVSTVSEWECRASLAALGRRNFPHKTSFKHDNSADQNSEREQNKRDSVHCRLLRSKQVRIYLISRNLFRTRPTLLEK